VACLQVGRTVPKRWAPKCPPRTSLFLTVSYVNVINVVCKCNANDYFSYPSLSSRTMMNCNIFAH
jgi:hypothetical protein